MIELVLILIFTLIWWLSEVRSLVYLSNLFFLGGIGVMLVGVMIALGTMIGTGNWNYQFADTVNPDPIHERTARDWRERIKTRGGMLRGFLLGLPLLLLGVLVHLIWG